MKKHIDMIWEYNYWANRRLLDRAEGLTQEQLTEHADYMWDTVLRTMTHVLSAEWIWRQRVQEGVSPTQIWDRSKFGTLAELRAAWEEEEAAMRGYLDGLIEADLNRVISYKNAAGEAFQRPLWQLLTHVVNHGTQHRSEVALALTNYELSPGDMDITLYLTQLEAQEAV